ncbi:hypothetical protein V6N13_039381 [Hibiscus sabdariffa]
MFNIPMLKLSIIMFSMNPHLIGVTLMELLNLSLNEQKARGMIGMFSQLQSSIIETQIRNVIRILKGFKVVSGLKLNLFKSKIIGINVEDTLVNQWAALLHSLNKDGVIASFGEFVEGVWQWNIALRRRLFDWELASWNSFWDLISYYKLKADFPDSVRWTARSNGVFSFKSFCSTLLDQRLIKDPVWSIVRNATAPPKVASFVWKVVHGRIPTRSELLKRNIVSSNDVLCPMCSKEPESVMHFACHCIVSWQIWLRWCNL